MSTSSKPAFVPLQVHSCYSLLSGVGHPLEWAQAAVEAGYDTLAITDVDGLYGAMEHEKACKATGLRALYGIVLTQPTGSEDESASSKSPSCRALLIARNRDGFAALCRLVTNRCLEPEKFDLLEQVCQEAAGMAEGNLFVIADDAALLDRWRRALPAETLYAGLILHACAGQKEASWREAAKLAALADTWNVPVVALPAAFFPGPGDWKKHAVLRAIGERSSLAAVEESLQADGQNPCMGVRGRYRAASPEAWLKPPDAMHKLFEHRPDAIRASREIADRCNVTFDTGYVRFPDIPLPEGETPFSRLWKICFAGARRRYRPLTKAVVNRLRYELETIEAMGFAPYFLIVDDILRFARRENIPCIGRGSASGSLALYVLGATCVDPIENNLSFERFLNPERTSPPDVDLDFCWRRRDDVVEHVFQRYGRDRVAMLSTHVTFAARSAIREVARALGLPERKIGQFTRRIPSFWHATRIEEAREKVAECRDLPVDEEPFPTILELAVGIDGFPRHLGVHASGILVAPHPLTELVPLQRAAKGVVVTQYDMYGAEYAGLVKLDLLCNRSLSVIVDTKQSIQDRHRVDLDLDDAERIQSDPATRTLIREGDSVGCFYIESPAMRSLLRKLKVDTLPQLTAASSVIRPGVAESGMMQQYIARSLGEEQATYLHPALEEVLGETFGVMIYQEDVLYVAMRLAGLSPGEGDLLRRAMSGKTRSSEAMQRIQNRFLEGCRRNGIDAETTQEIWRQVESFAGYAFCKAHSASFAVVSFQTAFLRAHFPAEFLAGVLSNQGGFYQASVYLEEARRMGLKILLPDINRSDRSYRASWIPTAGDPRRTVARHGPDPLASLPGAQISRSNAIRIGLLQIKGLTEETASDLLEEREQAGFFTSLSDFLRRVPVGDSELEVLVKVGAFDAFEWTRPELLWKIEEARARRLGTGRWGPGSLPEGDFLLRTGATEGQVGETLGLPFDAWQRVPPPGGGPRFLPRVPDWSLHQKIRLELEHLDLTPSGHPMTLFRETANRRGCLPAAEAITRTGKRVRVAGWLAASKRVITKKGDHMRFLTLEDETGLLEVTLFPRSYQRWGSALDGRGPYVVEGKIEEDHGALSLTADRIVQFPEGDRGYANDGPHKPFRP